MIYFFYDINKCVEMNFLFINSLFILSTIMFETFENELLTLYSQRLELQ